MTFTDKFVNPEPREKSEARKRWEQWENGTEGLNFNPSVLFFEVVTSCDYPGPYPRPSYSNAMLALSQRLRPGSFTRVVCV